MPKDLGSQLSRQLTNHTPPAPPPATSPPPAADGPRLYEKVTLSVRVDQWQEIRELATALGLERAQLVRACLSLGLEPDARARVEKLAHNEARTARNRRPHLRT